MGLLIQNVQLDGQITDVLIEGSRFKKIGSKLESVGVAILDGQGEGYTSYFCEYAYACLYDADA